MERSDTRIKLRLELGIIGTVVFFLFPMKALHAELALPPESPASHSQALLALVPPPPAPQGDDGFPESRFGSPPSPPDLGRESVASQEGRSVSRAPASVSSVSDTSVRQQPVLDPLKTMSVMKNATQEVAVIVSELGYFPKQVFVTRDIPVRMFITAASRKISCLMIDPLKVHKEIRSGNIVEVDFIPTTAGSFRIHCPITGIEGTLQVKDVGSFSGSDFGK